MWKATLFLSAALPVVCQPPAFHPDTVHGRKAYVIENGRLRVSALRGGGHLAEIRLKSNDPRVSVNPMRVPHYRTIEPYEYNPALHDKLYGDGSHRWLSSGYMGHLLCFPSFGAPSEEEVKSGLGNHGEAPIVEWKQNKVETKGDATTLWYSAELTKTQFRVERAVTIRGQETVVHVEEWAENLTAWDRPVNWVQHATFGAPFAMPGKTVLDVSAGKGRVGPGRPGSNSLRPETEIEWPSGTSRDGKQVDLRVFQPVPHAGTYFALLLDQKRPASWFTMYSTEYRVLIGYLWPTAGNPWIGDWQENENNTGAPWDGKAIARGMEFGSTPFGEGLRKSVERGLLWGVPVYRWIGGLARVKNEFTVFLVEIPDGFAGVEDVSIETGAIAVRERGTGKVIRVAH